MKCPGQDMQYWNQNAIFDVDCPNCGAPVEFYKDDTTRTCKQCGHRFVNPKMDFGCAAYCAFAEQCIGSLPEEFVGERDNLLKDRVAVAMKRFYHADFKRIGQMLRRARHAEKIAIRENADPAIVLCAAYLDGSGTEPVPAGKDDAAKQNVHQKSAEIARTILTELGATSAMIERVCAVLRSGDQPADDAAPEQKALADARLIARLEDLLADEKLSSAELQRELTNHLISVGGREQADATFRFTAGTS